MSGWYQRVESVSHVLQRCPMTHTERNTRHDNLARILKGAAGKKSWFVEWEPRIRGADGRLRIPDLVFSKDENVIIADVGVSWEQPKPLNAAHDNKVVKYSNPSFLRAVRATYFSSSLAVHALILGVRGT